MRSSAGQFLGFAICAVWMAGCGGGTGKKSPTAKANPGYRQLTANSGENCCASLSADGKVVVFASDRASLGNLDIWIQNTDLGPARRLTDDPARDTDPVLSRDGKWVYFTSWREPSGVYRVSAEGGDAELMVEGGASPQVSPDGESLAVVNGGVALYSLSESKRKRITEGFEESHSPKWSPDGEQILFAGRRSPELPQDWWVMARQGGEPVATGMVAKLRQQGFEEVYPQAWLPGDWIVFAGKRRLSMTLWKAALRKDAAALRATDHASGDYRASYAGGRLVFDRWRVGLDVWSLPVEVNAGRALGQPVRLTNDGAQKGSVAVSLDGKRMAYHADRGDGGFRMRWMDLEAKSEKAVGPDENTFYSAMEAGGGLYLYGTGPKTGLQLFSKVSSWWGGLWTRKVCERCGMPRSISPDGKRALLWLDREMGNRIELLELKTGKRTVVIEDASAELLGPELSADGEWVSFVARIGETYAAYVVKAGESPVTRAKWRRVTEPGEYLMAFWAPGGELLYLLTQHGETNLNWLEALKLNGETKEPVGAPFTVYRFQGHVGPTKDPVWNHPAAVEGRVVMLLGESSQDVWLLDWK
ncbi:MAG: PD40 domain-containing protein [Acidobacteria bacterium]|nr:PD40 domain-containing protein [Acidobacteriota bacterium]